MSRREDGWETDQDNYEELSLEELMGEEEDYYDEEELEDAYVYGDEEIDLEDIYQDEYEYEGEDSYPSNKRGKYDYLYEEEEEEVEEEKPTLQEKVANFTNKSLDFVESKRFNTAQWMFSVGILLVLGVVIFLVIQASSNLESNITHQEQEGAQYVAREIAPEEYSYQEQQEAEIEKQREEFDNYVEEKTKTYEEQVNELGEVPEGYVVVQDADGTVRHVPEEELDVWGEDGVRENTTSIVDEEEGNKPYISQMEIEIMPSSEDTWNNNMFAPMDGTVDEKDLYQSRGQFIYFTQKALSFLFANQILKADFDPNTYEMTITLNSDSSFPLPEDFEDRLQYTYRNSGFQAQAPDALTISYDEMGIDEYIANN